jgi:hypothetical protein
MISPQDEIIHLLKEAKRLREQEPSQRKSWSAVLNWGTLNGYIQGLERGAGLLGELHGISDEEMERIIKELGL